MIRINDEYESPLDAAKKLIEESNYTPEDLYEIAGYLSVYHNCYYNRKRDKDS